MNIQWFNSLNVRYHQTGIDNRNYNNQKGSSSETDFYFLIQMLDGSGTLTVDDIDHSYHRDSVLLYRMSSRFSIDPSDVNHHIRNKVQVDSDSLDALLYTLDCTQLTEYIDRDGALILNLSREESDQLDKLFQSMEGATEYLQGYHRLSFLCSFLEAVKILYSAALRLGEFAAAPIGTPSPGNVLLKEILNYINNNFLGDFSLAKMAEQLHYSKEHLCRIFKKQMNISIVSFINLRRLGSAKHLLENSDISLQEIASLTGFRSLVRFHNAFREMEGMTPKQYRKLKRTHTDNKGSP